MDISNAQDFLLGAAAAGPPPAESEEEHADVDEEDPRGKCRPKPAKRAKPAKAGAASPPSPSGAAKPASSSPAAAKAAPAPSSPEILVGGFGGSSSSSAMIAPPAGAKAKGSAKTKAKAKAKAAPREPKEVVPAIGPGFVFYKEYTGPFALKAYANWTFYCKRPGCPANCQRTLGVLPRNCKLTESYLEPLAFLHAWRDCEIDPKLGHRKSPVEDADTKRFFDNHKDELSALHSLFATP